MVYGSPWTLVLKPVNETISFKNQVFSLRNFQFTFTRKTYDRQTRSVGKGPDIIGQSLVRGSVEKVDENRLLEQITKNVMTLKELLVLLPRGNK